MNIEEQKKKLEESGLLGFFSDMKNERSYPGIILDYDVEEVKKLLEEAKSSGETK